VIVYAGHDIITYRPCQPLGWGNALTWVGDHLADEIYGARPCGCQKPTDPIEDCKNGCDEINKEAIADLDFTKDPEELQREIQEIMEATKRCYERCEGEDTPL